MKITGFSPLIVTEHGDDIIKLFEDLGFEKRHSHEQLNGRNIDDVTMNDPNGNRVDVAQVGQIPEDLTMIRMNVDNFDEAFEMLTARGFTCRENSIIELPSSKSAMMISPSGFKFDLCQHLK